jgi:Peptidase C13 family
VASEEILELQGGLLQTHLARVQPQRPAIADLYFVGFAPYAGEDVFRKELDVIHPLMDQRFDTNGRSIRLVNHAGTLRDYPIATVSNLRRTLAAVATRMDREQDILVLYVTTHGSRNAVLATDLPPLRLYNIDPPTLKSLLDEAGIRNRVLVISACYSGTFIEPLRAPDTLIMTASTADRPSFGCGTESDFTYFGDAIFNQALRRTVSFEEAFAQALPAIQAREAAEGFEASMPQMAVGNEIRQRLAAVEKRLATAP